MSGSDPPTASPSDTPEVRVAKVQAASRLAVVMAVSRGVADLVAIVAIALLIGAKVVPVEPWLYVMTALAVGSAGARVIGRGGGSGGALGALIGLAQHLANMGKHG